MSFRNNADQTRRLGKEKSESSTARQFFGINQFNNGVFIQSKQLNVNSTSISTTRPLLFVTGTQIVHRNEPSPLNNTTATLSQLSRRRFSHHHDRLSTSTGSIGSSKSNDRIQLPRLDEGSEDAGASCSTFPSERVSMSFSLPSATSGTVPSKLATIVSNSNDRLSAGHLWRRKSMDVSFDDVNTGESHRRPLYREIGRSKSLRRFEPSKHDHEYIKSSANPKNLQLKIKSASKNVLSKCEQSNMEERLSSGHPEPQKRLNDSAFDDVSLKSAKDTLELSSEKRLQENVPDSDGKPTKAVFESYIDPQQSKLQRERFKTNDSNQIKQPHISFGSCIDDDRCRSSSDDVLKSDNLSAVSQLKSTKEPEMWTSEKFNKEFDFVWPELLKCLIEESVVDFENMEQHMELCMAKFMAGEL